VRRLSALLVLAWVGLSASARAEPVARFPEVKETTEPRREAPTPPTPPTPPSMPSVAAPLPPPAQVPPEPLPPAVPRRVKLRSGAEELADRGRRFEEAQRYTEAITAYSESIKLDSSRGETLLALGKLRARLGEASEAELLLSTAARYGSVAAEALTLRAHLRRAQGRDSEAARDLENAERIAPDDAARTEELSAMYAARGAWPQALSLWRRAEAASREADRDRQTKLRVRALTLLAAELDPVMAGAGRGYSWTRHAFARIAAR
jgi:tetratricopeptide (TPR) repeat protein